MPNSDLVALAYGQQQVSFGRDHHPAAVRPAPDREVAPAVAKAAMDSGVATDPIKDFRRMSAPEHSSITPA
jgi:malate dehydrogenase (oxaloacetate-decarboxylating)(NADP+)